MILEGLSNSSQKNTSGEVNISTAESLHLKNVSRQGTSPQHFSVKRSLPRLQLGQLDQVNISVPITQEESDVSNRLFTFMDEKEAERKIIQEYVCSQPFTKKGNKDQENKNCRSSIGLVKMIEDSRKKREDFFKKLTTNPTVVKDRSVSNVNKSGKYRTPRNAQNKFETLQPRSRSKTPKFEVRYSTPKHELEPRLFRAKSNLGKEKSKAPELKQHREERELVIPKKSLEEEQFSHNRDNLNEKILLKKKKELEKKLLAINGSLLELKKVENNRKKGKNGNKTLRKKSKSKLGRL